MCNSSLSESEPEDQIHQFWRSGFAHVNEPHTEQCQGKSRKIILDFCHSDPVIVQFVVSISIIYPCYNCYNQLYTSLLYNCLYLVEFYDVYIR